MQDPVRQTGTPGARLARAALATLIVAIGTLAASPAMADETADVTWGVRTANTDLGTDRQNFSYEVDPGAGVSDALVITNHDTNPLELALYGADGFTSTSGQLDVATKDTESVAVGAWVTFEDTTVDIPAGGSVEAPFTVTVPDNATPGDYAGGVITSLEEPTQEQGVTVDRRLGIRIHLRVGGELTPAVAIDNLRVNYDGVLNPVGTGDATVSYTINNTGNARMSIDQAVRLTGPFGALPMVVATMGAVPELLPGETWDVTVPVTGVFPSVLLSADVVLEPDVIDATGATTGLDVVQATATTWAVPWALLVLLVVLAAIVFATLRLLRRRRRQRAALEDARVADAVAQALRDKETVSA